MGWKPAIQSQVGGGDARPRASGASLARNAVGWTRGAARRFLPVGAFTLPELLVVMVVLGLILTVALPAFHRPRARSRQVACLGNLKIVGLAYRIYAVDHGDRYPMQPGTNDVGAADSTRSFGVAHFYGFMSNELSTPWVLVCPADKRRPATNWAVLAPANVSYFIGLDCRLDTYQALLGGDRYFEVNGWPVPPGVFVPATNAAVRWASVGHRGSGNVLLGDGSVQVVPRGRLGSVVRNQGLATNRVLIP